MKIPRQQYIDLFGPTTVKIQLADTNLIVEVEKDCTPTG